MERTTTCIPCVPSILEGFRRGGSAAVGVNGKGDGGQKAEPEDNEEPQNETKSHFGNSSFGVKCAAFKMNRRDSESDATQAHINTNTNSSNKSLPSLVCLGASNGTLGASSTNRNRSYALQKGRTCIGCNSQQDVVIDGTGISEQHCYIINEGQVVTLYPLAVLNSLDGFRVTRPSKLNHGSLLCFGHSTYFRFNHPPESAKVTQKIVIKGSSPEDESRRRLIKLQSKPSAQEVCVKKSNFPVPDASQFQWLDFDKELGLKPSLPIELRSSDRFGQTVDTRHSSHSAFPHVRPVRNSNSLPASQTTDARLRKGRFLSQGLEPYPLENSEFESPSPTFPPSQHFPQDPKTNVGLLRHWGGFSGFPVPHGTAVQKKESEHGNDDSNSGTHSTETSSLSLSSCGSGVKVSQLEPSSVSSQFTPKTPAESGPNSVVTSRSSSTSTTVTCSSSNSASFIVPSRSSGGYDNIANIKAAIVAAAAAKLANCSKPVVSDCTRNSSGSSEGHQSSRICLVKTEEREDSFIDSLESSVVTPVVQDNFPLPQGTTAQRQSSGEELLASEPDSSNITRSEIDSSACVVIPLESNTGLNQPLTPGTETVGEIVDSSTVLSPSSTNSTIVTNDSSDHVQTPLCKSSLVCVPASSVSQSSFACVPASSVSHTLVDSDISSGTCSAEAHKNELSSLPVKSGETQTVDTDKRPENSVQLKSEEEIITENRETTTLEETCKADVVCSSKPPIGKAVQENGKPTKSERRSVKTDKKPSEIVSSPSSLFKSLLSRSRSPSPKGRANRSPSPSSTKDRKTGSLTPQNPSSPEENDTDEPALNDSTSENSNQVSVGEIIGSKESSCEKQTPDSTLEGSTRKTSDKEAESCENPWRINLRESLRPNLENFKGEKVFTKDTVTTNLIVGLGLDCRQNGFNSTKAALTKSENRGKELDPAQKKLTKVRGNISDSAQDLRSARLPEQPSYADAEVGYISDSGLTAGRDPSKVVKFCRSKGKKSVTFAEECKESSSEKKLGTSLPSPDRPVKLSSDMDRVVEGRSPTEKTSVSENVRTYLEMVDSGWPKTKALHDDYVDRSGFDQSNMANHEEPDYDWPADCNDPNSIESNILSEFNNNSSPEVAAKRNLGGDVKCLPDINERESVSLDDLDLDDIGASQLDLKQLYQQQRAGRLEEQRCAEVEKQRLEEIMKLCSKFGLETTTEKSSGADVPSSIAKLNANHSTNMNSSSLFTEDNAERSAAKLCPIADKNIPISPQTFDSRLFQFKNCLTDERTVAGTDQILGNDVSPTSPVVDSGIDISTSERPSAFINKEFVSTLRDRKPSDGRRPSAEHFSSEERRLSGEIWPAIDIPPRLLAGETQPPAGYNVLSRIKGLVKEVWNDEKSKQVQWDLLRELQRDVVQSIADIKQKIAEIETRQSEAVREVEMERALLEGEQQIQMEQLDRIKEKIVSLEKKEADVLTEAVLQRSKEMDRIRREREKLIELEHELRITKETMSEAPDVSEDVEIWKRHCLELQDAVDAQQFLVDNLEFQQLEAEAHYDEEKEIIQRELNAERDYLESLSNQHQVTLKQIALQQSDLLKQVDLDVFQLEKERQLLAERFRKENAVLYNINRQIQDALPSPISDDGNQDEDDRPSHLSQWSRPRLSEAEVDVNSRTSYASPRKISAKFSHTIPKIDSQRIRAGDISDDEERRFLYELKMRSTPRTTWDRSLELPDEGVGDGSLVQWHQGPVPAMVSAAASESEESNVSGSDPLSDKAMSLSSKEDQLHDMECLLVLAKAEGLRLVEEQMHQRDIEREALEQERRRRKELERRLAEEIAKHNDVIEQAIKLREKEKLQARPLTRYLPVRDRTLDLQQFIVAAGHSVDQCAHLAMTSTSCRGFLTKMGSRIRTWKKRWFVFDRNKRCLSYYGDKSESRPRGVIYFQAIEDVFVDHLHQVKSPTPQLTFCVKTYDRMYYLVAPSPDAMRIWIDVIFTGAEGYQQFA